MVAATAIFYANDIPNTGLVVTAVAYLGESVVETQEGITYYDGYTFGSSELDVNLQYRIVFTAEGVDSVVAVWGGGPG